jgi:hypothetical protein
MMVMIIHIKVLDDSGAALRIYSAGASGGWLG